MSIVFENTSPNASCTWECPSCGGQGNEFTRVIAVEDIRRSWEKHVKQGHRIDPTDTQEWTHNYYPHM